MNLTTRRIRLQMLALFFLLTATPVIACECGPWRFVEDAFAASRTVVTAELRSVRLIEKKKGTIEVSVFVVVKSYKGKYKAGEKITFRRRPDENCTWNFARDLPGKPFLLYLGRKPRSGPSTCSRTGRMENAHPDIPRLEKLVKDSASRKEP